MDMFKERQTEFEYPNLEDKCSFDQLPLTQMSTQASTQSSVSPTSSLCSSVSSIGCNSPQYNIEKSFESCPCFNFCFGVYKTISIHDIVWSTATYGGLYEVLEHLMLLNPTTYVI